MFATTDLKEVSKDRRPRDIYEDLRHQGAHQWLDHEIVIALIDGLNP